MKQSNKSKILKIVLLLVITGLVIPFLLYVSRITGFRDTTWMTVIVASMYHGCLWPVKNKIIHQNDNCLLANCYICMQISCDVTLLLYFAFKAKVFNELYENHDR